MTQIDVSFLVTINENTTEGHIYFTEDEYTSFLYIFNRSRKKIKEYWFKVYKIRIENENIHTFTLTIR